MKKCSKCKLEQNKKEFVKDKNRKDGLYPQCKTCVRKIKNQWNLDNPSYHKDYHKNYLKTNNGKKVKKNNKLKLRYGITLEDYEKLLKQQNNKCKICGTNDPKGVGSFKVDHDHVSGKIRGLLCHNCNVALGSFNDSIEILARAIEYLSVKGE